MRYSRSFYKVTSKWYVCSAIRKEALSWRKSPEWYPLFENHFLYGTVLADFSFESRKICLDYDFRIGEYGYFRRGRIGVYRNRLSKLDSGLILGDLKVK